MYNVQWEDLEIRRAAVDGGWLVTTGGMEEMVFIPDPDGAWAPTLIIDIYSEEEEEVESDYADGYDNNYDGYFGIDGYWGSDGYGLDDGYGDDCYDDDSDDNDLDDESEDDDNSMQSTPYTVGTSSIS